MAFYMLRSILTLAVAVAILAVGFKIIPAWMDSLSDQINSEYDRTGVITRQMEITSIKIDVLYYGRFLVFLAGGIALFGGLLDFYQSIRRMRRLIQKYGEESNKEN